jgi:hypothetical protein
MPNKNGLILITPTSIVSTGTGNSSSIASNGSVTCSSAVTLSLNGVFTADYDNYLVVVRHKKTGSDLFDSIRIRMRSSGTDATTNYTFQDLTADSTTVSGARDTTTAAFLTTYTDAEPGGFVMSLYGPYLSQPTAVRSVSCYVATSPIIRDVAGTHSTSSSYDGITLFTSTGSRRFDLGRVAVYGMRK